MKKKNNTIIQTVMAFLFNRHSYSPPRNGGDSKHSRPVRPTFTRRQLLFDRHQHRPQQQQQPNQQPVRNVMNTGRNREHYRSSNNASNTNTTNEPHVPRYKRISEEDIEKKEKTATEKAEAMKSKTEKQNESALGDLALASADFAASFDKAIPTTKSKDATTAKKKVRFNLKKNKKSNISTCVTDSLSKKQRLTSGLGMKKLDNIVDKKLSMNTKTTSKKSSITSSTKKKTGPIMKKTRKLRKKPKTPYETVTCGKK